MRSSAACVTVSYGYGIVRVLLFGKSHVMLKTHYDAVLGMYDVRHM